MDASKESSDARAQPEQSTAEASDYGLRSHNFIDPFATSDLTQSTTFNTAELVDLTNSPPPDHLSSDSNADTDSDDDVDSPSKCLRLCMSQVSDGTDTVDQSRSESVDKAKKPLFGIGFEGLKKLDRFKDDIPNNSHLLILMGLVPAYAGPPPASTGDIATSCGSKKHTTITHRCRRALDKAYGRGCCDEYLRRMRLARKAKVPWPPHELLEAAIDTIGGNPHVPFDSPHLPYRNPISRSIPMPQGRSTTGLPATAESGAATRSPSPRPRQHRRRVANPNVAHSGAAERSTSPQPRQHRRRVPNPDFSDLGAAERSPSSHPHQHRRRVPSPNHLEFGDDIANEDVVAVREAPPSIRHSPNPGFDMRYAYAHSPPHANLYPRLGDADYDRLLREVNKDPHAALERHRQTVIDLVGDPDSVIDPNLED